MPTKKTRFSVSVDPEVKDRLDEEAERRDLNRSQTFEAVVEEWDEARGADRGTDTQAPTGGLTALLVWSIAGLAGGALGVLAAFDLVLGAAGLVGALLAVTVAYVLTTRINHGTASTINVDPGGD